MEAFNAILQLLTKELKLDASLGAFVSLIFVEENDILFLLMWLTHDKIQLTNSATQIVLN